MGGIVIFVPQIALLFLFIAILEETGYMSRVVFITAAYCVSTSNPNASSALYHVKNTNSFDR